MRKLLIFPLLFLFTISYSQTEYLDLEKLINGNVLLNEDEVSSEELNSILLDLLSDPVDLNTVTENILSSFQFISPDQVQNFLAYRDETGPFISVWELQAIEGWDMETCNLLQQFVVVIPITSQDRFKHFGENSEILVRHSRVLQEKNGFTDSIRFLGSANKWQLRLKSSKTGSYHTAIAFENDSGEPFEFHGGKIGFDHLSGNLSLFNLGPLNSLTIGDFRIQSGQGIIYGNSFGGRKSTEPIMSIRKSTRGIIPSSSFGEFGYKRGIALSAGHRHLRMISFLSYNTLDATLRYDSLQSKQFITSVNQSGLHRNSSELKLRNSISLKEAGGVLSINLPTTNLGIEFNIGNYSSEMRRGSEPYQVHRFDGKVFHSQGLFLEHRWQNFFLFHETGISNFDGLASITGIITAISKGIDLSILYRYYAPGYYAPSGRSFAETSSMNNESGIYLGIKYPISRRVNTSAFFDYFKFPWLRFGNHSPSNGYEYSLRIDYISKLNPFYFLLRREIKEIGGPVGMDSLGYTISKRANLAFNGQFQLSDPLSSTLRVAAAFTRIGTDSNSGFLLSQNLKYKLRSNQLVLGYSMFTTTGYDSRLYARESDVRYQTTFPLFYGEGVRYFFLIKLRIQKRLNLWFKYYLTSYRDRDEIGSGKDMISGNKISEIRTQVIYSFK